MAEPYQDPGDLRSWLLNPHCEDEFAITRETKNLATTEINLGALNNTTLFSREVGVLQSLSPLLSPLLSTLSPLLYSTLLYSTLHYSTLLSYNLLYSTLLFSPLLSSSLLYSPLLYSYSTYVIKGQTNLYASPVNYT